MEIYLMRHGVADKEGDDPGLTPEGEAAIKAAAQGLARMGVFVGVIITSPKARAGRTAELTAGAVGYPVDGIVVTEAVKAKQPAETTVDYLIGRAHYRSIMVVGHLPNLPAVAFELTRGASGELNFGPGTACLIDVEGLPTRGGTVRWVMSAEELGRV